jgi:hypothetical protein
VTNTSYTTPRDMICIGVPVVLVALRALRGFA